MSRPPRIEYSGAWYHVMNRGANHQTIFHHTGEFNLFLNVLSEVHEHYGVQIHAYCLMSNHYHLLLHTPNSNLSKAMHYLGGVYTRRYNRVCHKDGPLFRGRFKSILVDDHSYLLQLSRYIHLNPVSAKIVEKPEDYLWSSYQHYISKKANPNWLYLDETLNQFKSENQIARYKEFILDIDPNMNPLKDVVA